MSVIYRALLCLLLGSGIGATLPSELLLTEIPTPDGTSSSHRRSSHGFIKALENLPSANKLLAWPVHGMTGSGKSTFQNMRIFLHGNSQGRGNRYLETFKTCNSLESCSTGTDIIVLTQPGTADVVELLLDVEGSKGGKPTFSAADFVAGCSSSGAMVLVDNELNIRTLEQAVHLALHFTDKKTLVQSNCTQRKVLVIVVHRNDRAFALGRSDPSKLLTLWETLLDKHEAESMILEEVFSQVFIHALPHASAEDLQDNTSMYAKQVQKIEEVLRREAVPLDAAYFNCSTAEAAVPGEDCTVAHLYAQHLRRLTQVAEELRANKADRSLLEDFVLSQVNQSAGVCREVFDEEMLNLGTPKCLQGCQEEDCVPLEEPLTAMVDSAVRCFQVFTDPWRSLLSTLLDQQEANFAAAVSERRDEVMFDWQEINSVDVTRTVVQTRRVEISRTRDRNLGRYGSPCHMRKFGGGRYADFVDKVTYRVEERGEYYKICGDLLHRDEDWVLVSEYVVEENRETVYQC